MLTRWSRRLLLRRLESLSAGRLDVEEDGTRRSFGRSGAGPGLVTLRVHDDRLYRATVWAGSIGAAESYMRAEWSTDDLTGLLRLFIADPRLADGFDSGPARLLAPLERWRHLRRDNDPRGSRRNIAAHYDLGEDFFSRVLDPTLTYSCALFAPGDDDLESASRRKLDSVCTQLELNAETELLEIGSGWGSLALHAARHYGCRVVTTTISARQYATVLQRVAAAGLGHRVRVLCEDYRDLPGVLRRRFDRIASIEMIEAVGHRHLPAFFRTCQDLLHPGGTMLLQAITIADDRYEAYLRSVDFIRRHVFPGGSLPSIAALDGARSAASDLTLHDIRDLTAHYPPTLRSWRARLHAAWPDLALDHPPERLRLWDYYLCYCEAGFLERLTAVVQLLLARPNGLPRGSRTGA